MFEGKAKSPTLEWKTIGSSTPVGSSLTCKY
jgi:hypothetical protein